MPGRSISKKAFNRVQHHKLISILKIIEIDDEDLSVINNLYWKETTQIRVQGEISENKQIQRGVRFDCIVFSIALHDISIKKNIRFVDDTIIFTDNLEDLQMLMNKCQLKI